MTNKVFFLFASRPLGTFDISLYFYFNVFCFLNRAEFQRIFVGILFKILRRLFLIKIAKYALFFAWLQFSIQISTNLVRIKICILCFLDHCFAITEFVLRRVEDLRH